MGVIERALETRQGWIKTDEACLKSTFFTSGEDRSWLLAESERHKADIAELRRLQAEGGETQFPNCLSEEENSCLLAHSGVDVERHCFMDKKGCDWKYKRSQPQVAREAQPSFGVML